MGQEEDVAFAASVVALRCYLGHQRSVSKVEDVGDNPLEGEITVVVRGQGVDDDAFHHQLNFVVGNTHQLVVNHGAGDRPVSLTATGELMSTVTGLG